LEHEFYFPIYWECHHPNWRTPSFFGGVGLNHQPDKSTLELYESRESLCRWPKPQWPY
jgi:hypothetical protein